MFEFGYSEWFLILASFLTSTFTGIFGVGGGVLLLSFMPGLIPAAAIIPVHGFVQLFSNSTRVMFAWRSVRYALVWPYLSGGIFGAWLGSKVIWSINAQYIPAIPGGFILMMLLMSVAVAMGSFAGTHIRKYVPAMSFNKIFR